MYQFESLRRNGGFVFWGDYSSLRDLHEFIHDAVKRSSVLQDEGIVINLAYDIRKAFEGQRRMEVTKIENDEITLYGVEQTWPLFISQVALLRTSLAFLDTTSFHQAQMYLLEHLLESAIKKIFPSQSTDILNHFKQMVGTQESFISPLLGGRVCYFMQLTPAQRRDKLPMVLRSLTPMYDFTYQFWARNENNGLIDPSDFQNLDWDNIDAIPAKQRAL
jgi:hypothetical protein